MGLLNRFKRSVLRSSLEDVSGTNPIIDAARSSALDNRIRELERRVKYLEKRVRFLEDKYRRLFDVK